MQGLSRAVQVPMTSPRPVRGLWRQRPSCSLARASPHSPTVAPGGLEPPLAGPKPAVLPLHHGANVRKPSAVRQKRNEAKLQKPLALRRAAPRPCSPFHCPHLAPPLIRATPSACWEASAPMLGSISFAHSSTKPTLTSIRSICPSHCSHTLAGSRTAARGSMITVHRARSRRC